MAPTNGPARAVDTSDSAGPSTATPAAVAGYPSVTVPAVLRFAAAFERVAPARRAPGYLPTMP